MSYRTVTSNAQPACVIAVLTLTAFNQLPTALFFLTDLRPKRITRECEKKTSRVVARQAQFVAYRSWNAQSEQRDAQPETINLHLHLHGDTLACPGFSMTSGASKLRRQEAIVGCTSASGN